MCTTCGCSDDAQPTLTDLQTGAKTSLSTDRHQHVHAHVHDHDHAHDHDHGHVHDHVHQPDGTIVPAHHHGNIIRLEQDLLAKNRLLAERNRGWLAGRDILAL